MSKYYCEVCKELININFDQFYDIDVFEYNNPKRKYHHINPSIKICYECFIKLSIFESIHGKKIKTEHKSGK